MVHLLAVDHPAGVAVAPDSWGKIHAYAPSALVGPSAAVGRTGLDLLPLVRSVDDAGFAAYSDDSVRLRFDGVDSPSDARLLLKVKGFQRGEGDEKPFVGPPAIVVQALDTSGQWREVGRLRPRYEWSTEMYDLSALGGDIARPLQVRLVSVSHSVKYHEVDFVGLALGPRPEVKVTNLPFLWAKSGGRDVLDLISSSDDRRVSLATGNEIELGFSDVPRQGEVRDFAFISDGYYIPKASTFFVYTWDGSDWVQRDGYSTSGGVDNTMNFDLSLFLPDPDGEYKIRVWQSYKYNSARIDFAQFQVGATTGTLAAATDLRSSSDILSTVATSDDVRLTYYSGYRDRWTEYQFSGLAVNTPPQTSDVAMTGDTITWTYFDAEGSPQASCEVEIWTGPGGTGTIVWDPPPVDSAATSAPYTGPPLTPGETYYVRVRASDGTDWGAWSESPVTAQQISPAIPTVTRVGLVVLVILLAVTGLVVMRRYL
jgi:hypothetical protein